MESEENCLFDDCAGDVSEMHGSVADVPLWSYNDKVLVWKSDFFW